MTITVIIPVLNEARLIGRTLSHTVALGFDDVIVVDGGSSDATRALVESFATQSRPVPSVGHASAPDSIRLLSSPPGRARQLNAGANGCRGDVLLFLHADTLLPVDATLAISQALRDHTAVGGRFNVRFDSDRTMARLVARMMNLRSKWSGIATGDQALFVRREVFERLGGFADIPLMEDIDFTRRLKRAGRLIPLTTCVVTAFRRWEHNGPIRTIVLMWTLRFLYWIGVSPHRLQRFYRIAR